jgi:dTDP-4-amino-4,6-dideoxygalactose transaminase
MAVAATSFLPFHRASIEEAEIQSIIDVLKSGWLTSGPRVKEFETAFALYTGSPHAQAVNSCTSALHLALAVAGVSEGDEVLIPAMTFASTGETVLYLNARPVLVDCSADSFHIDIREIEKAITPRTRAIVPVHYAGYPCDMDPILELAERHGLSVIEDAAHAFPASYKGRMIGTVGHLTCFSFYATKTITTGEGGMITTANQEYADRLKILALHGISRNAWNRYTAQGTWRYDIVETGYKYNLTDLQAALGLAQLQRAEELRQRRSVIAAEYSRALASSDAFLPPPEPNDESHAWHLYVIRVNPAALQIGRDQVIDELKSRGIGTSVHFIPLHLHSLYQRSLGYREGQFPRAEQHFAHCISLPLFPGMSGEDVARVISALEDISAKFHA